MEQLEYGATLHLRWLATIAAVGMQLGPRRTAGPGK
jgi:hypothetical protein